jgi:TetR/AcrR family transcriptional repressor of nem operon
MRYVAGHKEQTRTRLLHEAAQSIRHRGVGGTSVDGVTAAAGMTRGGFYAHFSSREEMIAAGVAEMVAQSRIIPPDGIAAVDPAAALAAYIDSYLSRSHRDSLSASCALPLLASEASRLPLEARTQLAQGATRLSAMLAVQLERLGFVDPQREANSVLAELVGAMTLARAEQNPARSDAWLAHSRLSVRLRLGLGDC